MNEKWWVFLNLGLEDGGKRCLRCFREEGKWRLNMEGRGIPGMGRRMWEMKHIKAQINHPKVSGLSLCVVENKSGKQTIKSPQNYQASR